MKPEFLIIVLSVYLLTLKSVFPEARVKIKSEENKNQLYKIGSKIKEEVELLKNIKKKERDVLNQIDKIDQSLIFQQQKIRDYKKEALQMKLLVDNQESEIQEYQNYLRNYLRQIESKLVILYKITKNRSPGYFISYKNYNEFIRNNKIIEKIITMDMHFVDYFNHKLSDYLDKKKELMMKKAALDELNQKESEREKDIERIKTAKQLILNSIRSEKQTHFLLLEELEIASRHLSNMLKKFSDKIESNLSVFKNIESYKNKLQYPTAGFVEMTFGKNLEARSNTVIFNKGLDIRSPAGSPVYSVFYGRVEYAKWFQGYGNLIIVNHGNGYYSLYAHLSEISKFEGEWVDSETIIGFVGDTGSYKGAYLYFELRSSGQPVNPANWLRIPRRKK